MKNLRALAESLAQGGEGMDFVVGCHPGASAALDLGALGAGSEDGQAPDAPGVQGKHALVAHEHDAFGSGPPGEGRSSGGRHPVTPWGVPTKGKRTRRGKKKSDALIMRRRHKR